MFGHVTIRVSDRDASERFDPDGNSAEAVHHGSPRIGRIDHVWIRVGDIAEAKRFYQTVAPFTGFRPRGERADLAHFRGQSGSFSVVSGTPTEQGHLAFPTRDPDGNNIEVVNHNRNRT